jgi:phenylalanyl-tRNA synthetase beta chain
MGVVTPQNMQKSRNLPVSTIEQALGQTIGPDEIGKALTAYGYEVVAKGNKVTVTLPFYRQDLMHAMDVVEDVAISRGYETFLPVMPSQFTVGGLSRLEEVSDRVRALMVGMGFQEIISNILGSPKDLRDAMRLEGTEWGQLVQVDNVMSQNFSALRQWMIPSLLRVEAASNRAFYPHRLFEAGEVARHDLTELLGSRTVTLLGGMIAHADAHFSEAHSCLDTLFYNMNQAYSLEPIQHPSFLTGRVGNIVSDGKQIGVIGELHPEVLERWQISVPVVAFEIDLTELAGR